MGTVYSTLQFKLWADIDGTQCDLVQFACSYAMNTIPTCTAMLPVGYRVLPPFAPSPAHAITQGLQIQIPLTVYCMVQFCSGQQQPSMPRDGTYILFKGYVTGVGYRRTYDGYSMTINGTHWLSDLSYSSILCADTNPMNPTCFTFNCGIASGAGGGGGNLLPATIAQSLVTAADVEDDLWGKAIKPLLLERASSNCINVEAFTALGGNNGNDTPQWECTAALQRINAEVLPFKVSGFQNAGADSLAMMIATDLANQFTDATTNVVEMAHQTFWDRIVGMLAPTYMFKLVPFPTLAKVVPYIPGLRDFWDPNGEGYTFRGRDIEVQDMNSVLPRVIRAVGIFTGHGSISGAAFDDVDDPDLSCNKDIGGMYVGGKTGMVLMRPSPSFLANMALQTIYTAQVTQIRGNGFNHPHAGDKPTWSTPQDRKKDTRNVLDTYAQAVYAEEQLKNRTGDISTAIRFDVAPGSSVKIEGTSGSFMADGEARYGQIMSVGHYFDAQQQRCGTSFSIGYLHTEAEHQMDQYSVPGHPLYSTTWPGAKHITG